MTKTAPWSATPCCAESPGQSVILCLLTETIDGAVMDAAGPSLRVISNMAVGVDNIDVAAATARGILVTNTPGVLTDATADLAWALILSTVRRVVEGDAMVREGRFQRWSPFMLLGRSVAGATLGIVGMGRIGQAVARRALGWDMKVSIRGVVALLRPRPVPAGARWQYRASLDDLLARGRHRHPARAAHARHAASHRRPRAGAHEARLVSGQHRPRPRRGRGGPGGGPAEAATWAAPAWTSTSRSPSWRPASPRLPNATLLPHLGSATVETRGRMAELAALNAIAAVRGEPVPHPVNPEVLAGTGGRQRRSGAAAAKDGRMPMRRRSLWLLLW